MKEEQLENKESNQRNIQDYLSLGYLYLLVLGIAKDAIFYGFLDVNIINYSNVQDLLLSPIVFLAIGNKRFWAGLIFFILIYFVIGYLLKKNYIKNKDNDLYKTLKNYDKLNNFYGKGNTYDWLWMVRLMGLFLFGAFIGAGVGGGKKISNKLKIGMLKNNQQITFNDNKILNVNLIGHNSEYLFYAAENDTTVTIVPIQGNIKKIQNIE